MQGSLLSTVRCTNEDAPLFLLESGKEDQAGSHMIVIQNRSKK